MQIFNRNALIYAAWNGRTENVHELLIQKGIDINNKDILALKNS